MWISRNTNLHSINNSATLKINCCQIIHVEDPHWFQGVLFHNYIGSI
jgi:hypothetical protein